MIRGFKALIMAAALAGFAGVAAAQDRGVWVQVEAQPTLGQAQTRVRAYAGRFEDVNGYYLGGGWYGIALGPYAPGDAAALLARLRSSGAIPADSFIADGQQFQSQFWPIGVGAQTAPQDLPQTDPAPEVVVPEIAQLEITQPEIADEQAPAEPVVVAQPVVPDETAREAQASEALLSRPERELLQTALQWAGYYNAAIDGAFGRGTRASMAAWQGDNGFEPTGILTTRQRAVLLGAYNAVLDGLDLQLVRDDATGIEMQIPTGVVTFSGYEPPFARFDPSGELDATVLLISQEGDQSRLFGLYEIMQTLEIVPPEGPRSRSTNSFELEGIDGRIHSTTYAALADGQIKGFTLIWPAGDEERRTRLLGLMRASFTPVAGVLDPALRPPGEDQAVDLISGLAVRKPILSRSGFYIDARGTALTTTEVVDGCGSITLDSDHAAQVVLRDDALGIAVLRPQTPLAPIGVAVFQTGVPRLQAEVAVSGYPYGGVLAMPALTFGRLADIRGLNGEDEVKRLTLTAQPGDVGGPVFDNSGAVLGMLLPRRITQGQVLPPEVGFAVDAGAILGALDAGGIEAQTTDTISFMPPETLTRRAADMTVLVSCWD
ncbi:MAG: peptidoglycan-binding protein [Rhodobacterales bacterium]|nr:peptidoglycan-binding protein [Rhodobacterales bacterium]